MLSTESTHAQGRPRAFTLMELMIVIIIIAVVISILIPAVAGARNAARRASTARLMKDVADASGQFYTDQGRLPGHFSAREMAHADNMDQGFMEMHNIVADLAGGITGAGNLPAPTPNSVLVGPMSSTAGQVWFDHDRVGLPSGGKAYLTPDAKHFIAQTDTGQQAAANLENARLKSLVDEWGNPILAWRQDERAIQPVAVLADFAAETVGAGAPARFYWATNAGFLKATSLGKRGYNQTDPQRGSILSDAFNPAPMRIQSMAGILGSPSAGTDPTGSGGTPTLPAAGRAKLIIHSAGTDGVFVGVRDPGMKQFAATRPSGSPFYPDFIDYAVNFVTKPSGGERWTDNDGKPTSRDVMSRFDDQLLGAGN
ncbi:MAG: prepilin-type N-terminal cleavage/methylation domain-containing protein [Phycisphaerales bacterium]